MAVESAHGFLPLPPGIPVGVGEFDLNVIFLLMPTSLMNGLLLQLPTVVQSYAGGMSLSVTAEKWAVPDADSFLIWVMEEYIRLRDSAGIKDYHNP